MSLGTQYDITFEARSLLEDPDPGSGMVAKVIESHLEGDGRRIFTTRELLEEMRQPYCYSQLQNSAGRSEYIDLLEEDMDLWLYVGQV